MARRARSGCQPTGKLESSLGSVRAAERQVANGQSRGQGSWVLAPFGWGLYKLFEKINDLFG